MKGNVSKKESGFESGVISHQGDLSPRVLLYSDLENTLLRFTYHYNGSSALFLNSLQKTRTNCNKDKLTTRTSLN